MTAFLYTWDPGSRRWCFNDILNTEDEARAKGRELWRQGVAGIKIDVTKTVVETLRSATN